MMDNNDFLEAIKPPVADSDLIKLADRYAARSRDVGAYKAHLENLQEYANNLFKENNDLKSQLGAKKVK